MKVRPLLAAPLVVFGTSSWLLLAAWNARFFPGFFMLDGLPEAHRAPLVVLLWLGLHAVVSGAYWLGGRDFDPVRILGRVALALAIVVVVGTRLHTIPIRNFPRWVNTCTVILAVVLWLCLEILLRRETRELRRSFKRWLESRGLTALWHGFLTLCPIVVASELAALLISHQPLRDVPTLRLGAIAFNVAWLVALMVLLEAAVGKGRWAWAGILPPYLVLAVAAGTKARYLQTSLEPTDYQYLPELSRYFVVLFGRWSVLALLATAALWLAGPAWLWWRSSAPVRWRVRKGVIAIVILMAPVLLGRAEAGLAVLRVVGVKHMDWDSLAAARENGFVADLLLEASRARAEKPPGYSAEEVQRRAARYATIPAPDPPEKVNLVLYVVESLIDPDDLGVRFTSDPMPELRRLKAESDHGHGVVPNLFTGSGNSEFEILTGMNMGFLPKGNCPYKQYVNHPLPSLVRFLKAKGYRSRAFHVDPPTFYDRNEVYPYLGIDDVQWLGFANGKLVRARGEPDAVLVKTVLEWLGSGPSPSLVFAFSNGTHSPYNDDKLFADIPLDVVSPLPLETKRELTNYGRALRAADTAIATLVKGIEASGMPTLLVVLGDHLPPLRYAQGSLDLWRPVADERSDVRRRMVPLLFWSSRVKSHESDLRIPLNELGVEIIDRLGFRPEGFWSVVAAARHGATDDYRMLQYDLLLGERYAGPVMGPG